MYELVGVMWLIAAFPTIFTVTSAVRVGKVEVSAGEASAQGRRSVPRCDERPYVAQDHAAGGYAE